MVVMWVGRTVASMVETLAHRKVVSLAVSMVVSMVAMMVVMWAAWKDFL